MVTAKSVDDNLLLTSGSSLRLRASEYFEVPAGKPLPNQCLTLVLLVLDLAALKGSCEPASVTCHLYGLCAGAAWQAALEAAVVA
jgi:hypothetical protein